jgi:hypothetical protein
MAVFKIISTGKYDDKGQQLILKFIVRKFTEYYYQVKSIRGWKR